MTLGQNSLNNFYTGVKFHNPRVAVIMSDNVVYVALGALSDDKTEGQAAADDLRKKAIEYDLPDVLLRVLNSALTELGYS
jgi:hypothetical protein